MNTGVNMSYPSPPITPSEVTAWLPTRLGSLRPPGHHPPFPWLWSHMAVHSVLPLHFPSFLKLPTAFLCPPPSLSPVNSLFLKYLLRLFTVLLYLKTGYIQSALPYPELLSSGCAVFHWSPWTEGYRGRISVFVTFDCRFWNILASFKCFPPPLQKQFSSHNLITSTLLASISHLLFPSQLHRLPIWSHSVPHSSKISYLHFPIWHFCLDFYWASPK